MVCASVCYCFDVVESWVLWTTPAQKSRATFYSQSAPVNNCFFCLFFFYRFPTYRLMYKKMTLCIFEITHQITEKRQKVKGRTFYRKTVILWFGKKLTHLTLMAFYSNYRLCFKFINVTYSWSAISNIYSAYLGVNTKICKFFLRMQNSISRNYSVIQNA